MSPRSDGMSLLFQRQNNFTYRSELQIGYRYSTDHYQLFWQTQHENLLNSNRSDNPFVQLQFHHILWQHYSLSKHWTLSNWIEIDQFFSSGNQRYSPYLGVTWKPMDDLRIQPLVGYSWDFRSGRLDQGISPALFVGWLREWEDKVVTDTRIRARYKNLSPRRQINLGGQSTVSREFEEGAQIAFTGLAGANEMNDYRSESVERIRSDTLGGLLSWSYRLKPKVVWESDNRLFQNRRIFEYKRITEGISEFNDLRFGQLDAFIRQKLSLEAGFIRGYFLYEYQYLSRRYEVSNNQMLGDREFERIEDRETQKDYFRNQTNMEFLLQAHPWKQHQLDLIGTNRYLKYDTPSGNNFDDHDELNYGLTLGWQATWARDFQTTTRLIGSVRRYAFLFQERSQDNYTQHNLRLEFIYTWTPTERLKIEGAQFIYVTYNVKDFEDRNLTDRSTRNLETKLRWAYRVNRKMDVDGELFRRQVHVSYLNWEQFSETTLDTTTQFIARADWHYRPSQASEKRKTWSQIDLGYKHVAQLRYLNTSMTSLENILTPINLHQNNHQTGPVTGGSWRHGSGAVIALSVWWQLQVLNYDYVEVADLSTLNTRYREQELIKPVINFRPFIRLQLQLALDGGG